MNHLCFWLSYDRSFGEVVADSLIRILPLSFFLFTLSFRCDNVN
jgi:hypothetical protein